MNFIMFCGYPRSGHTLVAAIINAHPNMICSNQLNILNTIDERSKESLLQEIRASRNSGWKETTMITSSAKNDIMAIGDKTGHRTITTLIEKPGKLNALKSVVDMPIKWVHVVRNPFDNLATWARLNHRNRKVKKDIKDELDEVIEKYFDLNRKIDELHFSEKEIMVLYHEDVVDLLGYVLEDICKYFEVPFNDQWRENCGRVVWKKPRITRRDIEWRDYQIDKVNEIIDLYPWLIGYEFGGCC